VSRELPVNLRSWLRRAPAAAQVRVQTPAGERIVRIDPKAAKCWALAAATIEALDPLGVEALDAKGNTLRAFEVEVDDPELEEPEADEQPATHDGGDLRLVAKLLNEAHDAGAKRHADAYKESFSMLAGMVKATVDANNNAVKMVNMLAGKLARAAESTGKPDDDDGELFKQLLLSRMGGGGGGVPPELMQMLGQMMNGQANGMPPKPEGH
jgi:hypothetical protein